MIENWDFFSFFYANQNHSYLFLEDTEKKVEDSEYWQLGCPYSHTFRDRTDTMLSEARTHSDIFQNVVTFKG